MISWDGLIPSLLPFEYTQSCSLISSPSSSRRIGPASRSCSCPPAQPPPSPHWPRPSPRTRSEHTTSHTFSVSHAAVDSDSQFKYRVVSPKGKLSPPRIRASSDCCRAESWDANWGRYLSRSEEEYWRSSSRRWGSECGRGRVGSITPWEWRKKKGRF